MESKLEEWMEKMSLAEGLMDPIAEAMESIRNFVEAEDGTETKLFGCRGPVDVFEGRKHDLMDKLKDAASYMEQDWNSIVTNEMKIERARRFVGRIRRFLDDIDVFDLFVTDRMDTMLDWLHDEWAARSLFVRMTRYVREHSFLFDRIERDGKSRYEVIRPFEGSAERFRRYFIGAKEADIEGLFRHGSPLPGQPRWLGRRCEAVVFGQSLSMPCSTMNRSFEFIGKNGGLKPLNYQRDVPRMASQFYSIYALVQRQKELMEMEVCRQ